MEKEEYDKLADLSMTEVGCTPTSKVQVRPSV